MSLYNHVANKHDLPAESFPHLGETLRVFLASEFDYAAEFDFGLDLILDGLERLRA